MQIALNYHIEGIDIEIYIKPLKPSDLKSHIASTSNKLNKKLNQLEQEEKNKSEKVDNQDFEKAISIVKANGYNIDRHTLPLSEWVEILKNIEEKAKSIGKNK